VSDFDPTSLSQSQLGDYVRCPRYYALSRDWDVATPDETTRYLERGLALHGAIEDTWLWLHPAVDPDAIASGESNPIVEPLDDLPVTDEALTAHACEAFTERWARHVSQASYRTESHYAFDRTACRAAIEAYFGEGPGRTHLRQAIGSEVELTFERAGRRFQGKLDLISRTDAGLHVIDYKSSLSGIISTYAHYGQQAIEEHRDGEAHRHRDIKSLMQATIYRRAARELDIYEPGESVAFSFYGLREDVEYNPSVDGVVPNVEGREREMTAFLDDHEETAWAFIEEYATGIRNAAYAPEPWELINDTVCEGCPYREMCPDYLATEVRRIE